MRKITNKSLYVVCAFVLLFLLSVTPVYAAAIRYDQIGTTVATAVDANPARAFTYTFTVPVPNGIVEPNSETTVNIMLPNQAPVVVNVQNGVTVTMNGQLIVDSIGTWTINITTPPGQNLIKKTINLLVIPHDPARTRLVIEATTAVVHGDTFSKTIDIPKKPAALLYYTLSDNIENFEDSDFPDSPVPGWTRFRLTGKINNNLGNGAPGQIHINVDPDGDYYDVTIDILRYPPPVNQSLATGDRAIDEVLTNETDQNACRSCHQTSGTNISGGYNNTIGGVPTRHHLLVQRDIINPYTGTAFNCQQCHPTVPGVGNGIFVERSCVNCHNGTSFWANSVGGFVGNFSRPHHVNASYASSNIGNPAANRTCNFCHGSFINNYNDQHYKPSYATDFMITPFATFKVTNFSQPDGLGGNKTWGGCLSCHLPDPSASPVIGSNHDNHHKEILGLGRFGGQTQYQNASTPGAACSWCHVIAPGTTRPLRINITNDFTGELLTNAMEVRNSTIELTDVFEPGTTNITINGTGCEKCHDVRSLHNIQVDYVQNGPQGKGHINNDSDCNGCHNSWLPATDYVSSAIIPSVDNVEPSVLVAETAATLTITGNNFVNDPYASNVTVDGVTYYPTSVTNTEIVVNIPGLTAGTHQLQIVKGGDTLSKLYAIQVVPAAHITSAKISKGVITITGTGFRAKPATNAQYYVSINHAGNQIVSTAITSWSNTQIKAKNSAATAGDVVTVLTADSGETTATITTR